MTSTSIDVRNRKTNVQAWSIKRTIALLLWGLLSVPIFAVEIGEMAPSFTIESLTGDETVSLDDFKGKVVILDFLGELVWSLPRCYAKAFSVER